MIAKSWFDRCWQWQIGGCVAIFGTLCAMGGDRVNAQIVPDNTLGAESSVVTPDINLRGIQGDRIDGGATRGANLFHSFSDFNVGQGRGVYFANPAGIENILTRVTGNNSSNISGRLGVLGGANLFLLNPNGIVFGPNATLDIQGSFVATTAGRIQLGDSGYFSATEPQTSSLLSVSPGALFFNAVATEPTSIINQGNLATPKNLTLSAGNLDLQGQLKAGGDLTLQAQDTVKVRDSVTAPFLANSGGNLTIIGARRIDILALNHPTQTPFVSGGNLSSIGDGIISLDARFSSGGSFSIQSLSGGLANFVSLYDPIISSNGDVDVVANYTGASLLVESKGNIRILGDINITGPDTSGLPAGPDTATLSTSSALILRSGQSVLAYGGVNFGAVPNAGNGLVPAGITLGGNVTLQPFNGAGGIVKLLAASGNVSTRGMTTNGGAIDVNSAGSITTNGQTLNTKNGDDFEAYFSSYDPNSNSYTYTGSGQPVLGGGAISLLAANGNITTGNLDSYSLSVLNAASGGGDIRLEASNGSITTGNLRSLSSSDYSNAGQGGAISLTAANGSITTGELNSSSYTFDGNAGRGGAIGLTAANNISIEGDLYSFSYSNSATAGEGGAIFLIARSGDIVGIPLESYDKVRSRVLGSFSISEQATAGNGGNVVIETKNNVSNLDILTLSSSSLSGTVRLTGLGDLLLANTNIVTSKQVTIPNPLGNSEFLTLNVEGIGRSGDVTVSSLGNLTFNNSSIQSDTKGSDNAGNVTVSSPGLVTFNNSFIRSNTSSAGAAGSINIEAGQGITLVGSVSELSARTTNQGKAGDITLSTPQLTLQNGANIATTTASSSAAGNITLQSHPNTENLNINLAPGTSISASTSGQGTGGNIEIQAQGAIAIQGESIITTDTTGAGNAGRIEVTSRNLDIQQTELSTSTTGSGNAGDITLDTSTLTVARGAQVFARTNGSGNSGTITANASTAMNLGMGVEDFSPVLSVETSSAGQPGSIIVNTPSLTLSNTARITATATNTATNPQGGGSITLNASTMNLAGVVGVFAETQGQTPAGTLTLKPYENQSTLNLTLAPQSLVSASTNGSGKGGNLIVQAPFAITIRGEGQLAVQTTGDGAAGDLRIDTQRLTIADGATISASTSSKNPEGTGGNLTINATESFNLTDRASLRAQSTGAAPAGNIAIRTGNLTANNGTIATSTEQSSGGSINITASNIRLYGNSDITSRVNSGAGGGGNIDLKAGEIIAFDDSDILAFARDGRGGNITLDTPVFFGESYRPTPRNIDPDTLDRNNRVDINATGTLASGTIALPDTTFIQNSLTDLPGDRIDTDSLLANSCIVRRDRPTRGSFTVTGTGGLPQRPGDVQMSDFPTVDVETLPSEGTFSNTNPNRSWQKGDPIIEPQGVYRLPNGKLVLSRECS
ncbi:MAG: filamentous hemagglutinin N-terminal domain-containing protein [Microcoleus sp. CSU_2_2]|nr:filamentous hemagglutinin N-terminal domain-containing protein [Microcoleus sp. SU_5_3]NJS11630.1 filamentous hemagglutinin N-terminal domain-containing protein [Microcoleus sp. CSU_2_2]